MRQDAFTSKLWSRADQCEDKEFIRVCSLVDELVTLGSPQNSRMLKGKYIAI